MADFFAFLIGYAKYRPSGWVRQVQYRQWKAPDGRKVPSFTMLTVDATGHPVMHRFHKPGDEKRSVVILAPDDYEPWLTCKVDEAPAFLRLWPGELETSPR